jgi:hypothetical protein
VDHFVFGGDFFILLKYWFMPLSFCAFSSGVSSRGFAGPFSDTPPHPHANSSESNNPHVRRFINFILDREDPVGDIDNLRFWQNRSSIANP